MGGDRSEARTRRGVSTANYALCHHLLRAAAERFVGSGKTSSAAYAIIYRGFDHHHIRAVCENLKARTLTDRYKAALGRSAASQHMRDFASTFPELQDARHAADYHPTYGVALSQAISFVDLAGVAITAFERCSIEERDDVLALMLVKLRS